MVAWIIAAPAFAAEAVRKLGQPCRAKQILGAALVVDRQDGRERLILLNDNETYGCELLYIDVERDTGEVYPAPAGSGSWTGIEVPGDRFVVGTFYDGTFMVFDLKARKFTQSVRFAGEGYLWNLGLGKDGRVYGGTYPGGKLGALDLETYQVHDLGAPATPNQYLRYVSAAPWGQVFANFGMEKSTTKIYDPATKAWSDVPGLKPGTQFGVGVTWNGLFVAHDPRTGRIEAFADASLTPSTTSVLASPDAAKFSVDTQLTTPAVLYLRQGNALYRLPAEAREFDPVKLMDVDLRGGRYVAVTRKGDILGLRGQSYFVIRPGASELKFRPVPSESRGRPSLFLEADAEGRIWGGPHFGQTLFYYDIASGKSVNTDAVCDGGGEVYDVAFHAGLVYAASYAGGDISCYDPAKPWDQWNHTNPRPVASVSPAGYIRPAAGIVTGPDGKLYAGWMAKYGTYGGAVSITDPASGKTELIENPCGAQSISSFALGAGNLYVGTGLDANGLPHQKGPAHFGVVDLQTRKLTFDYPVDASSVSRVTFEPKSSLVLFTVGHKLRLYDPRSSKVVVDPVADLPDITGDRMLPLGDGTVLVGCGPRLVKVDPAARSFATWADLPVTAGTMAVGADGRVYFGSKADLYGTVARVRE
jgi:hypothetical protein